MRTTAARLMLMRLCSDSLFLASRRMDRSISESVRHMDVAVGRLYADATQPVDSCCVPDTLDDALRVLGIPCPEEMEALRRAGGQAEPPQLLGLLDVLMGMIVRAEEYLSRPVYAERALAWAARTRAVILEAEA